MRNLVHVDIETAIKLKELRFNEDCEYRYVRQNTRICKALPKNNDELKLSIKKMEGTTVTMIKNKELENNESLKFFNSSTNGSYTVSEEVNYAAPTVEHVINWLRENHNIQLVVIPIGDGRWQAVIYDVKQGYRKNGSICDNYYKTVKIELKNILDIL